MWFDPSREAVRLYRFTPPVGSAADDGQHGAFDRQGGPEYLDKVGSVSVSGDDDDSLEEGPEQFSFDPEDEDDLPF